MLEWKRDKLLSHSELNSNSGWVLFLIKTRASVRYWGSSDDSIFFCLYWSVWDRVLPNVENVSNYVTHWLPLSLIFHFLSVSIIRSVVWQSHFPHHNLHDLSEKPLSQICVIYLFRPTSVLGRYRFGTLFVHFVCTFSYFVHTLWTYLSRLLYLRSWCYFLQKKVHLLRSPV